MFLSAAARAQRTMICRSAQRVMMFRRAAPRRAGNISDFFAKGGEQKAANAAASASSGTSTSSSSSGASQKEAPTATIGERLRPFAQKAGMINEGGKTLSENGQMAVGMVCALSFITIFSSIAGHGSDEAVERSYENFQNKYQNGFDQKKGVDPSTKIGVDPKKFPNRAKFADAETYKAAGAGAGAGAGADASEGGRPADARFEPEAGAQALANASLDLPYVSDAVFEKTDDLCVFVVGDPTWLESAEYRRGIERVMDGMQRRTTQKLNFFYTIQKVEEDQRDKGMQSIRIMSYKGHRKGMFTWIDFNSTGKSFDRVFDESFVGLKTS